MTTAIPPAAAAAEPEGYLRIRTWRDDSKGDVIEQRKIVNEDGGPPVYEIWMGVSTRPAKLVHLTTTLSESDRAFEAAERAFAELDDRRLSPGTHTHSSGSTD